MSTVLIVDHAPGDASVLASALRVEGQRAVVASSLTEAREALALGDITLAVVDLMVRGENGATGLELAREIRREHPFTRVVLTSAYHLSERQLERADCGVSGFIPKPYDVAEVVAFVRQKVSSPPSSRRLWNAEPSSGTTSTTPDITPRKASAR